MCGIPGTTVRAEVAHVVHSTLVRVRVRVRARVRVRVRLRVRLRIRLSVRVERCSQGLLPHGTLAGAAVSGWS